MFQARLWSGAWRHLFVLSCARFIRPADVTRLAAAAVSRYTTPAAVAAALADNKDAEEDDQSFLSSSSPDDDDADADMIANIESFMRIVTRIHKADLDNAEFMNLWVILVYQANLAAANSSGSDGAATELADRLGQAQRRLLAACLLAAQVEPPLPNRFGELLVLAQVIGSVRSETIQELFFKTTLQAAPIDSVVLDIFKKQTQTAA